MNSTKSRSNRKRLLALTSSVRLTIVLLLLMAGLCILGTLIPQQAASAALQARLSPAMRAAAASLGVFDLFHSFWLAGLSLLLCLNLLMCTLRRLPAMLRETRRPAVMPKRSENLRLAAGSDIGAMVEAIRALLVRRYRIDCNTDRAADPASGLTAGTPHVSSERADVGRLIFAERNRFGILWTVLMHMGVVLIVAGMWLGHYGFEGHVEIPVDGVTDQVALDRHQTRDLGFQVRCDDFKVDFYEGGMPREYSSKLAFMRDGAVVTQGTLRVNHPLVFEGIRFYQSNYRPLLRARIALNTGNSAGDDSSGGTRSRTCTAGLREIASLGDLRLRVMRIENNFMGMGPAVELAIATPGGITGMWVFAHIDDMLAAVPDLFERAPKFNPRRVSPYVLSLEGLESNYATGLMVSHDPGVPLVVAGSLLLLGGILLWFLAPRRRIWIEIRPDEQGAELRLAAMHGRRAGEPERSVRDGIRQLAGGTSCTPRF